MARLFTPRQFAFGASVMVAALLVPASDAAAQAGGRMRVLVPDFAAESGAKSKSGEKLGEQLRKQINTMVTHAPVDTDDKPVKDGLRKFGLKESDMDCVKWLQLASQTQVAQLVLCGEVDEATGKVTARFTPIGGGEPFEVPEFRMQTPDQGAQQVVQAFNTYIKQLSLAVYCDDYAKSQSWQQALDACTQALELNQKSSSLQYARGAALRELNRNEEALDAFKKVLELDPLSTDALLSAGLLAAKLGQQDVSQQYFHQYLELNPGNEAVRLKIATDLATAGDPAGALKLMEELTSKEGATALAHRYAGFFAANAALAEAQKAPSGTDATNPRIAELSQKAITNLERAMQLEPDSVDAQLLRTLMLAYRGTANTAKAIEIGQQATATSPDDALTWSIYSEVLKDAKRTEDALRALERAGQIDPNLSQLNARKAVLYLELGNLSQTVAAVKAAAANNEIPAATVEQLSQQITVQGYQHSQARRYDQAIANYNAAREIGRSERSQAMANFFHGATLFTQADALLRNATTAAPARQAKPLLDRAKTLMEGAAGYTDQAAKRGEILESIKQFTELADALIKQGR